VLPSKYIYGLSVEPNYIDEWDRRGVPGWWQIFGDGTGCDGDSLKIPDVDHGYIPPHIPLWALSGPGQTHYSKYLESANWRTLRRKVMKRSKRRCELCWAHREEWTTRTAQHVHHLDYSRLFFERMTDLLAVCYVCHSILHPGNDSLAEQTENDTPWKP
jgi:Pyruvate/2-oxoacid:ferredoxin oxidoreductase delta subunit